MDRNTKEVIQLIAEIQVEALKRLKTNWDRYNDDNYGLVSKLLQITDNEIDKSIDEHLRIYNDLIDMPTTLVMLSEYQLMLCSHILFKMEDEWITFNPNGVVGAWDAIREANMKYHPEFTLII